MLEVRPFQTADEARVTALWRSCGLTRPWNDPARDIARKLRVQPDMFLVAVADGEIAGSVMAGYDGHRGWLYYLGVDPALQGRGIGKMLVAEAESRLRALGCPKVNLQMRRGNAEAEQFYARLGYAEDQVVSYGKRLDHDPPVADPLASAEHSA